MYNKKKPIILMKNIYNPPPTRNKNINIVGGGEGNGVQNIAVIVYKTIKTRICTVKTLFKYKIIVN